MSSSFLLASPPRCQRTACFASSPYQTSFRQISSFQTPPHSVQKRGCATPSMSPTPSWPRSSSMLKSAPEPTCGDRFIPSRRNMNIDLCRRKLSSDESGISISNENNKAGNQSINRNQGHDSSAAVLQREYNRHMLSSLYNLPLESLSEDAQPTTMLSFGSPKQESCFASIGSTRIEDPNLHNVLHPLGQIKVGGKSLPKSSNRRIPEKPCLILDAPGFCNDFYTNPISWSKDNFLALALQDTVYIYDYAERRAHKLGKVGNSSSLATSVSWCTMPGNSRCLAIGTSCGSVELWDSEEFRRVRTLHGHSGSVGSLAWNQHWLTTGSRDSLIQQHDIRVANHLVSTYRGHSQEVCGLKWNQDGSTLASGGNENNLCIWDARKHTSGRYERGRSPLESPQLVLTEHKAAVKALDWCPFQRGVLASGGGTADRSIKLWNTNSGELLNSIETAGQVCSLIWSQHERELCSSHGFSDEDLILWKYGNGPKLTKIKGLAGGRSQARALGLACSPDGSTVVSASSREVLQFWDIFGVPRCSRQTTLLPMDEMLFGMPCIR